METLDIRTCENLSQFSFQILFLFTVMELLHNLLLQMVALLESSQKGNNYYKIV